MGGFPHQEHWKWGVYISPPSCTDHLALCAHKCVSVTLLIVDRLYVYTYLYTHLLAAMTGMANDEQGRDYDDGHHHSTENHRHEHLLVGWEWCHFNMVG